MGDFREFMRQQTLAEARLRLTVDVDEDDRIAVPLARGLALTVRIGNLPDCHLAADNAWLDRMSADEIRDVATLNTSVELLGVAWRLEELGPQTWALESPSCSTAVVCTMLDEQVPVPAGRALDLDRGVLVAVPTSRRVVFGALDGPGSFRRNVEILLEDCRAHRSEADCLAGAVFLVDEEGIARVATAQEDPPHGIVVTPPPWLRRAVDEGEL